MPANPLNDRRRCTARSKRTGNQCGRAPILGGNVCKHHGGAAPQVKAKAAERLLAAEAVKAFGLAQARDPERVVAEMGCIAFFQPGDLYDEQGRMRPVKELPPHVQAALGNIESVTGNVDSGDGQKDRLARVRVWDKPKVLEMLAKHHGLLKETVQHEGELSFRWLKS